MWGIIDAGVGAALQQPRLELRCDSLCLVPGLNRAARLRWPGEWPSGALPRAQRCGRCLDHRGEMRTNQEEADLR